ncbi:MAG: YitT family protein [Oscillospiraceae bacterium]|nr:YitT family protein [Oscillospiraceae bacterium]
MKKHYQTALMLLKVTLGTALFSLGFDLFLTPHELNAGGLSGLAQILVTLLGFGSVGLFTAIINLPLFIFGYKWIGKKFFWGSLFGMAMLSLTLELFALLPVPQTDPLLSTVYGGCACGLGLGLVFVAGGSTGGSDIIVRLLQRKWQHIPIGTINFLFDATVAALTGIVFHDMTRALYTGIAVFLAGKVIDMVVYSFDYSRVAIIITDSYEQIADRILEKLERGVTYLEGEGAYSRQEKKVILTAVKKHQMAELKKLVSEIDPNAFVIVQEAHQVLGDGFSHYSKESL